MSQIASAAMSFAVRENRSRLLPGVPSIETVVCN